MISWQVFPEAKPLSWQTFCESHPGRSVALDGYVRGGPRFRPTGPYANFNHHEEVDRLATRATCAQVLMAVRQGLFDTFHNSMRHPEAHVWVNDCDEDVCLSLFILVNSHLAIGTMNPNLNRLVSMEDMLDSTAGAYPFPSDLPSLQELMWVFEPYHRFRASGQLDRRVQMDFRCVVESVHLRIQCYLVGRAESVELDTRFQVARSGSGYSLVRETGTNARLGVYGSGIKAFVAMRSRPDGRWVYTLGRCSQFVPFPIPRILKRLNREEQSASDPWGGSDMVAGSPRVSGSRLNPDEVFRIIEDSLKRNIAT